MLVPEHTPPDCPKELYELYFVFCCVWAFGASLFQDQLTDHRVDFTKWWSNEFKTIKFPSAGTVFDYYIDHTTHKFESWTKMVPKFELDPDLPLQVILFYQLLIKPSRSELSFYIYKKKLKICGNSHA